MGISPQKRWIVFLENPIDKNPQETAELHMFFSGQAVGSCRHVPGRIGFLLLKSWKAKFSIHEKNGCLLWDMDNGITMGYEWNIQIFQCDMNGRL